MTVDPRAPSNKTRLTARQRQVFDLVVSSLKSNGYPPTVRDIAGELGIISLNAVRRHLQVLEKKGYLTLEPGKSRGIHITEGLFKTEKADRTPIVGRVAAGLLTEAVEDIDGYVMLDPNLWGDTDELFILKVKGDSMYPRMEEGDMVVVRRQAHAGNGDIVVAVIDDEATVKELSTQNGRHVLHAFNPDYKDIQLNERAMINGVVVGLIRKI